jgi:nucleotide-binding universal stress UspA family protein
MERIVVGVDGSTASKRALRWALDEAKLRGAELVAVHAWMPPVPVDVPFDMGPVPIDWEDAAKASLDTCLEEVVRDGDVPVQNRVIESGASHALIKLSETADLLVLGSRGHGGFANLLLGSVTQQCAQHASCPVVVIRGE